MVECLGRMGAHPNTIGSATCHFGEGQGDVSPPHTNLPQVINPSLSQTLLQGSARAHDSPQEDTYVQPVDHQYKKEETPDSKPEQEQYDVKEESESPSLGEKGTAQSSQPSQLPQEWSADPARNTYYQDTRQGPSEAPWIYVP